MSSNFDVGWILSLLVSSRAHRNPVNWRL